MAMLGQNNAYLTSRDLDMLEKVLQAAMADLVRLRAIPLRRRDFLEAREQLAILLVRHANAGERCPKRLREMAVFSGFRAARLAETSGQTGVGW
jgi:hypothetical protein